MPVTHIVPNEDWSSVSSSLLSRAVLSSQGLFPSSQSTHSGDGAGSRRSFRVRVVWAACCLRTSWPHCAAHPGWPLPGSARCNPQGFSGSFFLWLHFGFHWRGQPCMDPPLTWLRPFPTHWPHFLWLVFPLCSSWRVGSSPLCPSGTLPTLFSVLFLAALRLIAQTKDLWIRCAWWQKVHYNTVTRM